MFSTLRNRFGIPGVISVIALVFAMFGGAYAASNSSSGGKATASAKAKQGPRGKTGKTGPAGPQGPAGPAGPAGAKGDAGAAGASGSNGASATTASFSGNQHGCLEGGVEVKSAGAPTFVCNGQEGQQGQEGSPWPAGGTLPPGETETGTYTFTSETGAGPYFGLAIGSISFSIRLAAPLDGDHVIYVNRAQDPRDEVPASCEDPDNPGSASGENPEAAPGFLCIFGLVTRNMDTEVLISQPSGGLEAGAGPAGALILQQPTTQAAKDEKPALGEVSLGAGTWAVTAPAAP